MSKAASILGRSGLLAELAVVVLGVMIALAADSWRETALDSRIANQYQERLREDIGSGVVALREVRRRFTDAQAAALSLMTTGRGEADLSSQDLVSNILIAGAIGLDRRELGSDVTYRELLASGQLVLLPGDVRSGVVAYHREVERLEEGLRAVPQINSRIARATGFNPIEFLANGQALGAADALRLEALAWGNPDFQGEISLLHAELVFYDRVFANVIEKAERLLDALE